MITSCTTNPELLARLVDVARNHVMTPEEWREQRVSWVFGQMGHKSGFTKDEIRARLQARGM